MKIITTQEIVVLATSRTLTIPQVAGFSAMALPALEADAEAQGLVFIGPWVFVSHHLPQDSSTTFRLQLCRPVAGADTYAGVHEVVSLLAMRCGTRIYEGPLQGIFAGGYAPLLESLMEREIPLTGEIREVYHLWTDAAFPENRVEIQVGIAETPDHEDILEHPAVSTTDA